MTLYLWIKKKKLIRIIRKDEKWKIGNKEN